MNQGITPDHAKGGEQVVGQSPTHSNTDPIKTIETVLIDLVKKVLDHSTNRMPGEVQMYKMYVEQSTQAINKELLRAENRGRTDELVKLSEWGKTIDDQWNAHFKNRLAQLKQSQTEGGE